MPYNKDVKEIIDILSKILSGVKCVYKGGYYLPDGEHLFNELIL